MDATEKRTAAVKKFLTHARERLGLDVGFVLWDGSTVPANLPGESFAIVIADEGVIAALLRRPKLATLLDLWVSSRVDIRNGTIFDLAHIRPKVRTREFLRSLDKPPLLATIAKFVFVPRGGPWSLENLASDRPSSGNAKQDEAFIQYHYDISNKFYALFLDPELVYSCAYFQQWTNDLATAQYAKLEMICRKLRLKAGDSLLDVGCGWGALACHAAAHYGVRVHGITLSQQQLVYATEKAARLRLQGEVTFELKDHRSLQGSFDKIASIGMFEHVGIDHHSEYFHAIHRLLKPAGLYLHHAIVRPAKRSDREFRKKRPEYSVIIRHIFPGAELDHIGMSIANLERFGFEVHDVEGWREHYARTLRHWHDRLLANREAADREVGRERTRLWLAYLATCSIAFERGTLGIFQTLASKRTRGAAGLPPTRADLYR